MFSTLFIFFKLLFRIPKIPIDLPQPTQGIVPPLVFDEAFYIIQRVAKEQADFVGEPMTILKPIHEE